MKQIIRGKSWQLHVHRDAFSHFVDCYRIYNILTWIIPKRMRQLTFLIFTKNISYHITSHHIKPYIMMVIYVWRWTRAFVCTTIYRWNKYIHAMIWYDLAWHGMELKHSHERINKQSIQLFSANKMVLPKKMNV